MPWSTAEKLIFSRGGRNFADRLGKGIHVFKIPINRGETDVGDLVELLQLAHDQFAQLLRRDFALSGREQALLDVGHGGIDRLDGDGTLAQCQIQTGAQLAATELGTQAILLDHLRQLNFSPLVGCKAFVAGIALPTAANHVSLVIQTGIGHRRIFSTAERTFHIKLLKDSAHRPHHAHCSQQAVPYGTSDGTGGGQALKYSQAP
jgi:hypothetical protein